MFLKKYSDASMDAAIKIGLLSFYGSIFG